MSFSQMQSDNTLFSEFLGSIKDRSDKNIGELISTYLEHFILNPAALFNNYEKLFDAMKEIDDCSISYNNCFVISAFIYARYGGS